MDFRCTNCGAQLTPPALPGAPVTCHFCGAAQVVTGPGPLVPPPVAGLAPTPFPPPQGGFGVPPGGYGEPPMPVDLTVGVPSGGRVVLLLLSIGLPILVVFVVVAVVGARVRRATTWAPVAEPGANARTGFAVASLAGVTLRQTPEAFARATGGDASVEPGSEGNRVVHVALSGGACSSMDVAWPASDPSHAREVRLSGGTGDGEAAIRQRLAAHLGRRLRGDHFNWEGAQLSYGTSYARAAADPKISTDTNPHWKDQADALWDVMRADVLGLKVTVTDAEARDWLGRGYALSSLAAIDPAVDVDHSTAAMQAAFPSVQSRVSIGLRHTIALDHPLFGEAEVTWANEKAGTLQEAMVRPPPQATDNKFASQDAIEACVQAAYGAPSRRSESDHLRNEHDTEWHPPDGGEIRVYGHLLTVTVQSHWAKKMSRAGWQRAWTVLDACGRRR